MKNILVPTDFSPHSESACEIALEIAMKFSAEIHFLHIISTPVDWIKLPLEKEKNYPETVKEISRAKEKLNKLVQEARSSGLKSQEFIAYNKSQDEILEHIENMNHDFLVMGSYGTKGIKKIVGSNTQKVIQYAKVPSLIIKEHFDYSNIKNVILASDFHEIKEENILFAKQFIENSNVQLSLLFVNTPDLFENSEISNENMNLTNNQYFNGSSKTETYNSLTIDVGIQKYVENNNIDFVIIEHHLKSGLNRIFSHSITENLINKMEKSLLCLPIKQ